MGKYEELKKSPRERVINENVIGSLKRFKIISIDTGIGENDLVYASI